MANLESPKRGHWRVRWRDETGKRRTSPMFDDKAEAVEFQVRTSAQEKAARSNQAGKRLTLIELTEAFLLASENESITACDGS